MTEHLRRVSRALISVSDKTGLVEFARALAGYGIELVSTGGTRKTLPTRASPVRDIVRSHRLSGNDGRPRQDAASEGAWRPPRRSATMPVHEAAMRAHGIAPIDLLVVNLYPFDETVARGAGFDDCIENIDIGGPAMIRSAAKNHADVAVVVEPSDYAVVLEEFAQHGGMTTLELRRRLSAKAFARTAAYDAAIANWFANELGNEAPDYRAIGGRLSRLRYGENPHQSAAFYRTPEPRRGVATRTADAGQAVLLQQHQRYRRRLRMCRRIRSGADRRLRHRQARQSLRRRRRREPRGCLSQSAGVRSGLGVRRHRRAQSHARRRCRARRSPRFLPRSSSRRTRPTKRSPSSAPRKSSASDRRRPARPARPRA